MSEIDDRHIKDAENGLVLFAYGGGLGWTLGEDKSSKDFAWDDILEIWEIADDCEIGPDDMLPWEAP